MDHVMERAGEFDLVHFHTGCLQYLVCRHLSVPHVTTLHGRLDTPELLWLYERFREMPMISISNSQRAPWPCANWQATIYHGLPHDLFQFHPEPGNYLAFLGRARPRRNELIGPLKLPSALEYRSRLRRKSIRPTGAISNVRSSRCWTIRTSSGWAKLMTRTRTHSLAAPTHCYFRLIGRSRSGW
jgi:hypothetical protein